MNMMICLLRFGLVPKNLVSIEEATKARSIPTLSLSQSVKQTSRVLLLNHLGHSDPARLTTHLDVSC
jgi:hypothetical protein